MPLGLTVKPHGARTEIEEHSDGGKAEAPGKAAADEEEAAAETAAPPKSLKSYRRERWLAALMLLVLIAGIAVAVIVPLTRSKPNGNGGPRYTCISTDIRTFCWDATSGFSLPPCSVAPAGSCSPNGTPPCIGVGGIPTGYQCT
jgi:hypothetical protein